MIGKEWPNISEEKKAQLNKLAEKDIKRYQDEMEQLSQFGYFVNANGEKSTDLILQNPKFHDDVVLPKKPRRAYIFFHKEQYEKLSKKDPTLKITEIAKLAGEKWQSLSKDEQKPYYKLCEDDMIRQEQEMKQLLNQGYFINSMGVKSSDLTVKRKRAPAAESIKSEGANTTMTTKS